MLNIIVSQRKIKGGEEKLAKKLTQKEIDEWDNAESDEIAEVLRQKLIKNVLELIYQLDEDTLKKWIYQHWPSCRL